MIQKRLKQNINTSAIIDNTTNSQDIAQLKIDVANNTQSINTNSQEIGTLQTQVTQNTQDVAGFNQITTDLQTKYNGLESKVTVNEQNIADIKVDTNKIDPLVTRVNNIENKYVKKDESNTFTQTNTFTNQTNFQRKIEFRNPTTNNGAYLDNFDYYNENYTAFKLVKGSTNMLQIEVNNNNNNATISTPNKINGLHINNLANPTNGDNATNKTYVDNLNNAVVSRVTNIETSLANGNIVNYVGVYDQNTTYKIGQCVTYQDKWYVSKINSNTNNTPSSSSQQWELLSAPTIDLNAYLTKTDASSTYETIANVNALTTKVTTNETNINNKADASAVNTLTTRVDTIENKYAKKNEANTFTAINTFNDRITSNKGFYTASANADILKMDLQNEKKANIVFKQSTGGYKNFCNMRYLWTQNDTNYTNLLTFTFKPENNASNNQVEITSDLGNFHLNKPIIGAPNPTIDTQLTNKRYVDSRIVFVDKNNLTFHRQEINTTQGQQVTKYYCDQIPYADIATGCSHIISIACNDIPVSGSHLVITWFPKRNGNNALIEVYQYNSSTDITSNLQSATFQFVIQKTI